MKPWSVARDLARATASKYAAVSEALQVCRYCGAGGDNLFVGLICGEVAYFCYKCEPFYRAAKARLEREQL